MPRSFGVVPTAAAVDLSPATVLLFLSAFSTVVFACGFRRRKPAKAVKNFTFNDSVVGGSGGVGLALRAASAANSDGNDKTPKEATEK